MLRELRITNLVLIDSLELTLNPGLTVLTGETGAGKSIILQAVHLLAGGKSGPELVRSGAKEATVEARFEIAPERRVLLDFFTDSGFELEDCLVIRRIIPDNGKSRFYINGGFSTAALAGELLEKILAVASQHDHQQLLASRYHLEFLDAVGGLESLREKYQVYYDQWYGLGVEINNLMEKEQDKEQRRDFLNFQAREIQNAKVTEGEDGALTIERERYKASHDLEKLAREGAHLMGTTVSQALEIARKNMTRMAELDGSLEELASRITDASYEIDDLAGEFSHYLDEIPNDPQRLDEISSRLDLLQQLKRKYGPTLDEVIEFGERTQKELEMLDEIDERLAKAQKELAEVESVLWEKAKKLSKARKQTAAEVVTQLEGEFDSLCLDGASFEVVFADREEGQEGFSRSGIDQLEFHFSANPGEPLRSLSQVASGGELSRLMLGLRCILAHRDQIETVLFDEVDSGISGRTAEAVSDKIHELSQHHQVICITHLPQIASRASDHFQVKKEITGDRTLTSIRQLEPDERVQVVAGMLDGDSVSGKTLAYAKELLGRHQ